MVPIEKGGNKKKQAEINNASAEGNHRSLVSEWQDFKLHTLILAPREKVWKALLLLLL